MVARWFFGSLVCLGLATAPSACGGAGEYVWFSRLPADDATSEYLIAVGDLLNVRVLNHEEMATRTRVRGDGRIALPIIGEVQARGKSPNVLRFEIEDRLKTYLVSPAVTLNVEESLPVNFAVLGEVLHPGIFPLEPGMRMTQALAVCGGVTEFASRDRIFLVRAVPKPERIRFTYQALLRDEGQAGEFRLRPGDVVVVE